jgi:hypothetical protein
MQELIPECPLLSDARRLGFHPAWDGFAPNEIGEPGASTWSQYDRTTDLG